MLVHVGANGPVEIARHYRATPGTPKIDDAHFPLQPEGPLERRPRARNAAESEFLDLGEGVNAIPTRDTSFRAVSQVGGGACWAGRVG